MSDLLVRLQWQGQVNRILMSEGDRGRGGPAEPLLTPIELKEMEAHYEAGDTPEDFAWMLMDRDRRAQQKAENLNGDSAPSDTHYRQSMIDAGRSHLLR